MKTALYTRWVKQIVKCSVDEPEGLIEVLEVCDECVESCDYEEVN